MGTYLWTVRFEMESNELNAIKNKSHCRLWITFFQIKKSHSIPSFLFFNHKRMFNFVIMLDFYRGDYKLFIFLLSMVNKFCVINLS